MKLAEAISERVPSCERVRLMNSGTEATSTAVRLARGATGRDVVVTFNGNFHGATDALLAAAKNANKSQLTASDLEQILTHLNGTLAFQGVSGQIAFGPNGDPINKAVVILSITPEGYIQVDPQVEGQFLLK